MNPSRAKSTLRVKMPERDIRGQNITVKIGLKFCKLIFLVVNDQIIYRFFKHK